MKAVLCRTLDGPQSLTIEDVPPPVAGPGEVVVRVTTVALNFFDTLITRGKYQTKPELPFSPGGEIAGRVMSAGPDAGRWRAGDRVMAYLGYGGAREQVVVASNLLTAIPDAIPDAIAAGVPITYGTALHGFADRARLAAGEQVVISGAAGGAGLAAIEVAKAMGARVIAVASSAEKLAVCRAHGADELIAFGGDAEAAGLKDLIRGATGGAGADIVYDCVGGAFAERALRALRWGGRFLVVGFASGDIPKFPLNLLLVKGVSVNGVFWGESVRRDLEAHQRNMAYALRCVEAGTLRPTISQTFPLDEAADAIALLDERRAIGKIVLSVGS